MTVTTATLPIIRAQLDVASRKDYKGGVLGIKARPVWDEGEEFEHHGVPVRVVPCQSALAVREALRHRAPDRWLVILTDRDDADLGLGITAHFTGQRLRLPDPWAAVQSRFDANRIEHRLVTGTSATEIAHGLLAAAPPDGWPPARAGLLTADHAFGTVAAERLRLDGGDELDFAAVLRWTAQVNSATAVADLRALAGDPLVDALLDWVADRCGVCGEAVRPLLREGRTGDVAPLGLVARAVVASGPGSGPRALLGVEVTNGLSDHVLTAWAAEAESAAEGFVRDDQAEAATVLARAETLLTKLQAQPFAVESDVLRSGLTSRLAALGEALRRGADRAAVRAKADGPDAPLVDPERLGDIEHHRARVQAHLLATRDDNRVERALAAVRLARWLSQPTPTASELGSLVVRHRDDDAWADRAITQAWTGVEDEALAQGLHAVLNTARIRRDAHDLAFGHALATHHDRGGAAPDGLVHLEDLVATTVLPLAKRHPVLLVVADGLSQGVATEVVDDVVGGYDTWLECLPEGRTRRVAAIGVLPTLTKVCRASLFSGELTVGERDVEPAGFEALAKGHGLTGRLFHKLSLDSSPGGYALAPDVATAIDDVAGVPVVACVLNTIDDALDRSDPGGTRWGAETVKHLKPLLGRARRAGRVVVLTSDHGHVVERREGGGPRTAPGMSSNRSQPYHPSQPAGDGEVRVRGKRVLLHDQDAVLAVDERLRYGPLKAGYHGGAAPAEVVVPVSVLAPGDAPAGWRLAPPQSPAWWRGPLTTASVAREVEKPARKRGAARHAGDAPTLFDVTEPKAAEPKAAEPKAAEPKAAEPKRPYDGGPERIVAAVLGSDVYRQQRNRAARVTVKDEQVSQLLTTLLTAPDHRLDAESAAAALGIATVQLAGALSQLQRLLNVEQYSVLGRDPDGSTVVLAADLLVEQFGVAP